MQRLVRCCCPRLVSAVATYWFLAASLVSAAPATQADRLLQDSIRDFNTSIGRESDPTVVKELLRERADIFGQLMQHNPAAALASTFADQPRKDLAARHPESREWLEEKGEWTGPLIVTIAEDSSHRRTLTSQALRINGQLFRLYGDSPGFTCARSATVRGVRLGTHIAAVSVEATPEDTSACSTTGDQKTAVLMINYKSTSITSGYTASYLRNVFFGPPPSLTDYWREASYGAASASGDVFGPFTLDADYACNQQEEVLQAAIKAADSTVDFTAYRRIFLILPVTVQGGCSYDGIAQVGCSLQQSPSKGAFTASVTWLETPTIGPNIYGALGQFLQTVIHEGGHNFGLRHASSLDYDTVPIGPADTDGTHAEYGDPFSSMGSNPGHFAAPHKSMLGWLKQGSGYVTVQSAGTWTLTPLSQASGSPQALRVRRGTGSDQWLWIEYRQPIGNYEPSVLDNSAPRDFNGVLIHLEDPLQTANWQAYSELLNFQPVRLHNDFNQSLLKAGTTWSDPYSNLTLITGSASPSGISITVSYDNGCATLSSQSQSFNPSYGAGQISVQAPATCAWTAVSGAEWITLTSGQSGTGSGMVAYSVAPNDGISARASIVSISHQTFTINQAAQPQGGSISVAPTSGTGSGQTFSFLFADPTSWSNLTWGEVNINSTQITTNACYIRWESAGNQLYLRDDADGSWLGPAAIGSSAVLSNSQCVLNPATAKLTGSGPNATLVLSVAFTNQFANNRKNIYMQSRSIATACGWQQSGTWFVSFPFMPVSVNPGAGIGARETFTFTMSGYYPGDEVDLSFSSSSAFGTLQFYDHGCAFSVGPRLTDIFLFGDLASNSAGTNGTLGSGPALKNSQCTLNTEVSSAELSGSTLSVSLAITFAPAFTGRKNVYIFGPGTGWTDGASYSPVGWFIVTSPRQPETGVRR